MDLQHSQQVADAQKANLIAFFGLAGKLAEGAEKMIVLNLQVARSTLAEARESASKMPAALEPQRWFAPQTDLTQPFAEKLLSYGRQLFDITSTTQVELAQLAQAQYALYNARVQALVEATARNIPGASEGGNR